MEETKLDETLENTGETIPAEPKGDETSPQGGSLEETNKRLFARAKKAEEELKAIKESNKSQQNTNAVEPAKVDIDPFETVELINTLKDFAPEELSFIKTIAKGSGKSLKEAALSEDVKMYVEARREKIKNDNITPDPSNKQSSSTLTAEEALAKGNFKSLSFEEKERMIKEADAKYKR
jgi:plastocyanin